MMEDSGEDSGNEQHSGRQRAWEAMRESRQFALADLKAHGDVRGNFREFVRGLERAGYLKRVREKGNGRDGRFSLFKIVRDTGPRHPILRKNGQVFDPNIGRTFGPTGKEEPPLDQVRQPYEGRHGQGRAWQSMRILQRFTAMQVAATAEITCENASKFIKRLARTGYLRRMRPRLPSQPNSHALWQLIRNSGPQAPVCRRNGRVYDPNLNQVFEPLIQEALGGTNEEEESDRIVGRREEIPR